MPSLLLTTLEEFKELLGAIYLNKAVCFENIPPKHSQISHRNLCEASFHDINNSILKGVFPSQAKIAVVSLVDKRGLDKNYVLNLKLQTCKYIRLGFLRVTFSGGRGSI